MATDAPRWLSTAEAARRLGIPVAGSQAEVADFVVAPAGAAQSQLQRALVLPAQPHGLRRLARVRPKGMDTPMNVYSLLPPLEECDTVTTEMIADRGLSAATLRSSRIS